MRQATEQRRLLAVLVADIVGYSRLMAENEADTFYRLKDLQGSLIIPALERNHGHVVKWTGDGFLARFDSAVDAVRAAVEVQSGAAAAGTSTADDRRIRFRIGINAGCNDMGGTLMNESISRAAGASFGQEMPPEEMEALIRSLGRTPKQRTTLYRDPPADRIAASFGAAPLAEPVNTPARKYERPKHSAAAAGD